jgi:hypothetical protein
MQKTVDYLVHEQSMVRMERCNRRMLIIAILLFIVLIASNAAWLILT